jgi:serine/threonine-protein kinase
LKPGNIVVREMPDGSLRTKLLDFGLAKLTEPGANAAPQTNAGFVRGTPEYMAPEQARGAAVGPRTDLYAMGVVAFELLTGQLPFDADNIATLLQLQLTAPPPRPRDLEPSIPEGLEALVLRLLAKSPADRPSSASEVRRELQRLRKDLQEAGTLVGKSSGAGVLTVPVSPAVPRGSEGPITRKEQPPVLTAPPWANARTVPLPAVTLGPAQTDPGVEVSSDTNPVVPAAEATRVAAPADQSSASRWALVVLLLGLLVATVAWWLHALRSSPPAPTAPAAPEDPR